MSEFLHVGKPPLGLHPPPTPLTPPLPPPPALSLKLSHLLSLPSPLASSSSLLLLSLPSPYSELCVCVGGGGRGALGFQLQQDVFAAAGKKKLVELFGCLERELMRLSYFLKSIFVLEVFRRRLSMKHKTTK